MATVTRPARVMSAEQIEAMRKREDDVMRLRTTGMSFRAIDRQLGIRDAANVFRRAIARDENVQARRDEAIRLEEARLDALQEGVWGRAMGGDVKAVEVAVRILERRARMLGLDFSDLVAGKLVEVEQAKVAMMATALTTTLRSLGLPQDRQREATALFFNVIRGELAGSNSAFDGVPDGDLL
jgi:hypothetical protein